MPCHAAPPERVTALARNPEVRPYSAAKLLVVIRYSCTASGATAVRGPVTCELLFSIPSSRKFDAAGLWPFAESPRPREVPESAVTPGCVTSMV